MQAGCLMKKSSVGCRLHPWTVALQYLYNGPGLMQNLRLFVIQYNMQVMIILLSIVQEEPEKLIILSILQ